MADDRSDRKKIADWLKRAKAGALLAEPAITADIHGAHLAAVAATATESMPTLSTGAVSGPAAAAALAADQQVAAQQLVTDGATGGSEFDQLVTLYEQSPISGATTILDITLSSVGWNPTDPTQAGNVMLFANYVTALAQTPFFAPSQSTTQNVRRDDVSGSTDWNAFMRSVAGLFVGASPGDVPDLADTLQHLAHATYDGKSDTVESRSNLFVQHLITVSSDAITAALYWCTVEMKHTGGKHSSNQLEFTVQSILLPFQAAEWSSRARQVAEQEVHGVDEWLASVSAG